MTLPSLRRPLAMSRISLVMSLTLALVIASLSAGCDSAQDTFFDGGTCDGFKPTCQGDTLSYCFAYKDQDKQEVRTYVCPGGCGVRDRGAAGGKEDVACKDLCEDPNSAVSCVDERTRLLCTYSDLAQLEGADQGNPLGSQRRLLEHLTLVELPCPEAQVCSPQETLVTCEQP